MNRRWAPFAAAGAVVALVAVIALVAGRPDERDEPRAVAPAADAASPSAAASDPDSPVTSGATGASALPPPGRNGGSGSAGPATAAPDPDVASGAPSVAALPSPGRNSAPPPPSPAPRPSTAPSATPPATPGAGRAALAFDAAYGTDDPQEVIVQYGDSGSCPHEHVTKAVRESDDTVVVTLTADAQPPGRACTADYRQMLVPIALTKPLGTRRVIDAATGREVEVDRSCSRPFQQPPPPKDCTA